MPSVQDATPGARGLDCDVVLRPPALAAAKNAGFRFVVRYVTLGHDADPDDLATGEVSDILSAGLALMAVQHASFPPVDAAKGARFGANAAAHAAAAGIPHGVNLWLDLEVVSPPTLPADVIAYANAWFTAVEAAGYEPGVYVGAGTGLTGQQLFDDLKFRHYWRSGSDVPDIPTRGYQLVQRIPGHPPSIDGVEIDTNVAQTDRLGDNARWLTA